MQFVTVLLCLVVALTSTKAASISGAAGIDRNSAFAQTRAIFPRIPGINAPLSSLFPFRPQPPNRPPNRPPPPTPPPSHTTPSSSNNSTSSPSNNSTSSPSNNSTSSNNSSTTPSNDLPKYFDIPSADSLVPNLPQNGNRSDFTQNGNRSDLTQNGNRSDVSVPSIPELPDLSELPNIPGLSKAIQDARHHLQDVLQLGTDIPAGIEKAIQEAFNDDDPVAAVRTIIDTILKTYIAVAENCPAFVIGSRVLQEGIRLAIEAASSARNVITGSTSSPTEIEF